MIQNKYELLVTNNLSIKKLSRLYADGKECKKMEKFYEHCSVFQSGSSITLVFQKYNEF